MKLSVFIIVILLVSFLTTPSYAFEQLKCQITNTYTLSSAGILVEIQKNIDKYYKYNKIGANFYVDTGKGVVMGELSNIFYDKVTILNSKDPKKEGLTVLMLKLGSTNYLWINTLIEPYDKNPSPIKPFYWTDSDFIYTGTCR